MCKIDGKIHGQYRDVAKFRHDGVLRIASIGFEDQTDIDPTMPIRTMSCDAADCDRRLAENEARKKQKLPLAAFNAKMAEHGAQLRA